MYEIAALATQLLTINNIDAADDMASVSFNGIPPEWEIKTNQIRLHCIDGKPIELGRGGYGIVLFGDPSVARRLFLTVL